MPGVSRVTQDTAGGQITGNLAPSVFVDNKPIAVKNATIASHGNSPHNTAKMSGSSSSVYANGILVCRAGDAATCGHLATGSTDVFAG